MGDVSRMLARGSDGAARARRAFTILELLISILVVGLLIGLLLVGLRFAGQSGKAAAQRATVGALRQGVDRFKQDAGFLPPLVRDHAVVQPKSVEADAASMDNKVAVYASAAAAELRQSGFAPSTDNPFRDQRYSDRSLAYYVMGSLEVGLRGALTATASGQYALPIDGVSGPGGFRARADGTFEIPTELLDSVRTAQAPKRKRTGDAVTAYLDAGRGDPTLFTSPGDAAAQELRDKNGAPYRYYRWEASAAPAQPPPPGTSRFAHLNVPALVGRDSTIAPFNLSSTPDERDLTKNAALRTARYAIVAAGSNGIFGDESGNHPTLGIPWLDKMRADLALPSDTPEYVVRAEAAKDNIVEVGE